MFQNLPSLIYIILVAIAWLVTDNVEAANDEMKHSGNPLIGGPWDNRHIPYAYQKRDRSCPQCEEFTKCDKKLVEKSVKEIELFTCIKFQEYAYEDPGPNRYRLLLRKIYEPLSNGSSECYSQASGQPSPGRRETDVLMHLLQHCFVHPSKHIFFTRAFAKIAGLHWVHTRADRNQYVKVYEENMGVGYMGNLFKVWPNGPNVTGEYDVHSIVHATPYQASKNGRPTITRLDGRILVGPKLGRRMRCSDYKYLREFYNCGEFDNVGLKIRFMSFCRKEKAEDEIHEKAYISKYIP